MSFFHHSRGKLKTTAAGGQTNEFLQFKFDLSRFYRRIEFSGKLHRAIFAFIGDARVLSEIQKRATIG